MKVYYAKNREKIAQKERERYRNNRDKRLAQAKVWSDNNPETRRKGHLKRRYGVTTEWYDQTLAKQEGGCAICGATCSTGRALAVDHDHETGQVRGLPCSNHNNMLGRAQDSVEILEKAIAYLLQHKA